MQQVMIVDDDLATSGILRGFLSERGIEAVTISGADNLVKRFHDERPLAVILDLLATAPMDGFDTLATLKRIDSEVPIIILSGQDRISSVVRAMKLGASDFVRKPFDQADLELPLADALRQRRRTRNGDGGDYSSRSPDGVLFGLSPQMVEVRDMIERVADTDVTVLVRGESGTGKELVARAVHAASLRRDRPFVKVNCAALPGELLESELFGYERGAFTGAATAKPGKFEVADQGTMFLDEISEMSPALQAKLLHVLQDGEFARLGARHDVHVDVRIVAATNRNLERAVAQGAFREDLFFRLNVVSIQVPPLRHRTDEIPRLTEHFLARYAEQYRRPLTPIGPDTMALFYRYSWPGNVRELENLIKRAVVLGDETAIRREITQSVESVPSRIAVAAPTMTPPTLAPVRRKEPERPSPAVAAMNAAIEAGNYSLKDVSRIAAREAEGVLILHALEQTRWNRKNTAEVLGISYKALLYKMKEHGYDATT
jgi:two-component system response regulator AtoC